VCGIGQNDDAFLPDISLNIELIRRGRKMITLKYDVIKLENTLHKLASYKKYTQNAFTFSSCVAFIPRAAPSSCPADVVIVVRKSAVKRL
jgi:hypothetical protein